MLLNGRRFRGAMALFTGLALGAGCGSRSGLFNEVAGEEVFPGEFIEYGPGGACLGDGDCGASDLCFPARCEEGRCVELPPVTCDDGDECTEDRCDPETGACEFADLTSDEDGDGHRHPRPGYRPGDPGACGDDCDDSSALAFPGGTETCDGVDNDCNGVVDEDAGYVPASMEPVLVAENARESSVGSLAYNGSFYGVTYSNKADRRWENTFKGIGRDGQTTVSPMPITYVNTDTYAGPILWTGATFATSWDDRRDGDFEIYFNRLNTDGEKLAMDARITNAPDFSLGVDMVWNGSEFVLVWRDRRNGLDDYRIYGQRIRANGQLVGENVELSPAGMNGESPSLAQSSSGLGLIFNAAGPGGTRQVVFRKISPDLSNLGDISVVGERDAVAASLVFNGDRFVIAWHKRSERAEIGDAIYGAALDDSGAVIVPERRITAPAAFARSHSLLPLGDRLILVWAAAADRNGTYDIYTKMLSNSFDDLTAEEQVTRSPSDAVSPVAAFGPEGDIGVLYEDLRSGSWQAYFTRLTCLPGMTGG